MTKAIVFDTETTSAKQPRKIIEAAWCMLDDAEVFGEISLTGDEFQGLFDPGMPISLGAMATHHILQSEVDGQTPECEFRFPEGIEYVIGHKIDFDMESIGYPDDGPLKRICTLALARHHLPDLDSHSQSALMYHFFEPREAREMIKGAHRASDDIMNCAHVLDQLSTIILAKGIEFSTFEEMWKESERCRIPTKMDFGKHEGMPITELPYSYKNWLLGQDWTDKYLCKAVMATM